MFISLRPPFPPRRPPPLVFCFPLPPPSPPLSFFLAFGASRFSLCLFPASSLFRPPPSFFLLVFVSSRPPFPHPNPPPLVFCFPLPPPPGTSPGVCVPPGVHSGVLWCRVAVFCAACRAVVSRLAWLWAAVAFCVFCCVVRCCWLLLCVVPRLWLCRPASLLALWSLSRCSLCCRVLCSVLEFCAVPCCCALQRPALCCCALCHVVSVFSVLLRVVSCPQALSVALGSCAFRHCELPCLPALCALCFVCFGGFCCCVSLFAAVLCAVCVLGCCAVRFLSSPPCAVLGCAVLVQLRRAVCLVCAVCDAW